MEHILNERTRLPSGKEIGLADILRFCYDMSETDATVLMKLIHGKEYDVDTLAKELRLSKATINRSLNKLYELGLVQRRRDRRQGVGRPKFKYFVSDPQQLLERLKRDMEHCAEIMKNSVIKLFGKAEAIVENLIHHGAAAREGGV